LKRGPVSKARYLGDSWVSPLFHLGACVTAHGICQRLCRADGHRHGGLLPWVGGDEISGNLRPMVVSGSHKRWEVGR